MLEISMIQSPTSEAGMRNAKNSMNEKSAAEADQEFEKEYEAISKKAAQAESDKASDSESASQGEADQSTEETEGPKATDVETEAATASQVQPDQEPEVFPAGAAQGENKLKSTDSKSALGHTISEDASAARQPQGTQDALQASKIANGVEQASVKSTQAEKAAPVLATKPSVETVVLTKAAANSETVDLPAPLLSGKPTETGPGGLGSSAPQLQNGTKAPVGLQNANPATAAVNAETPTNHADDLPAKESLSRTENTQPAATVKPATVQQAPLMQVLQAQQIKLEAARDKAEISSVSLGDLDPLAPLDARGGPQATSATLAQVLNRPDTPMMIGRQMAEALQKLPDRPVEISLNPRELGRVRMNISAAEAGITVNVVAERPETLDLMRRNIDQLTREFQAIGYDNINFSFAEGETRENFGDGGNDQPAETAQTHLDLTSVEEPAAIERTMTSSTGVDIRL